MKKKFEFKEALSRKITHQDVQQHLSSQGCPLEIFISNDKLTFGLTKIPPKKRLGRMAAHSGDEIYYILSGECIVENPRHNTETLLKKGDIYYIPGGQIHAPRNDSENETVEILWFCTPSWP